MVNYDNNGGVDDLKQQIAVVIVPLPAQGHLNQLLHLSRLISDYDNTSIHYVGFSVHNRQAKVRIHGWNPSNKKNIHFHDFPSPSIVFPSPNPNDSNKFPSHLMPSFDTVSHLRHPFNSLMNKLTSVCKRVVIIHDPTMASVIQDVHSIPNVENYIFQCCAAFTIFSINCERKKKSPFLFEDQELNLPSFVDDCVTPEFEEFVKFQYQYLKTSSGSIYNTTRAIEGMYLDLLEKEEETTGNSKGWAIGPFNPLIMNDRSNDKCLEWLDKQKPNSVIFVSFGSTTSLSDEQIEELADGLEHSEQKFIWVLRYADKGNVFDDCEARKPKLPDGFEEKTKERGFVVRDWAPQLEILNHKSTGGFMSHCGWNSCMETISMGVPVLAWPMHSDQPLNSIFLTKLLRMGLIVRDWKDRNELVSSLKIEKAIRTLMDSNTGEDMRKRAAELSVTARESVAEGGVSRKELDSFVAHITRSD